VRTLRNKWILFVAARYIFKGRRNPLAVLGIATGVLALIVILAVMNGFQLSFIESILEISSFHLRIESVPDEKNSELRETLLAVPGITAAVPFMEFHGLARGRREGQQAVSVRGLLPNALELDPGMRSRLDFEDGFFDISGSGSVLLGAELARKLSVRVGDEVTLFSISGILSAGDDEEESGVLTFRVTGIFRTGYYEYDTGWAFININSAASFSGNGSPVIGVKLKNRFQDRYVMELAQKQLKDKPGFESIKFSSWRDYNRSFFGALRTEKLFMFILVGLIFIVVGLNIFQAQRRAVLERREEIGLLRAVGGTERAVRFVFVCDGAIIGFSGATAGLVLGLLVATNIPGFFSIMEIIANFFIGLLNIIITLLNPAEGYVGNFSFFSPAIFYIKEIPSRIIAYEVVLIFMFGFLSALLAAWFASRKISRIQPAEVLRYE